MGVLPLGEVREARGRRDMGKGSGEDERTIWGPA